MKIQLIFFLKWKINFTGVTVINLDICDIHSINRKPQHPPRSILHRTMKYCSTSCTAEVIRRFTSNSLIWCQICLLIFPVIIREAVN